MHIVLYFWGFYLGSGVCWIVGGPRKEVNLLFIIESHLARCTMWLHTGGIFINTVSKTVPYVFRCSKDSNDAHDGLYDHVIPWWPCLQTPLTIFPLQTPLEHGLVCSPKSSLSPHFFSYSVHFTQFWMNFSLQKNPHTILTVGVIFLSMKSDTEIFRRDRRAQWRRWGPEPSAGFRTPTPRRPRTSLGPSPPCGQASRGLYGTVVKVQEVHPLATPGVLGNHTYCLCGLYSSTKTWITNIFSIWQFFPRLRFTFPPDWNARMSACLLLVDRPRSSRTDIMRVERRFQSFL